MMDRRRMFAGLAGALLSTGASAQQPVAKRPLVGVLWHAANAEEEGPYFKALLQGFADLGYVEGRNIRFEHRFPNETPALFKQMAAELVALNVDVLMSSGNVAGASAKAASSTVPTVFMLVSDPLALKLVASIARPGGNVTGLSTYNADIIGKRLQILKEIMPDLTRVAQLVNPNAPTAQAHIELTAAAAGQLGLTIQTFQARTLSELEGAFAAMRRAAMQAVTVNPEGLPFQGRAVIPKLALAQGLALCAYSRETFEHGALMSYGPDQLAIVRRGAISVDKILKGAKPGELAVEGPTKFEFLLNRQTAKALGLTFPAPLLLRADEVIE